MEVFASVDAEEKTSHGGFRFGGCRRKKVKDPLVDGPTVGVFTLSLRTEGSGGKPPMGVSWGHGVA
jgi:hypothetical protein